MIACLASSLCLSPAAPARAADDSREWRFEVFLEDSPIGSQVFRLSQDGDRSRIDIEAQLDVKFLFFTAYSYRHSNEEIWEDGCLARIESTTDDNGKPFRVNGTLADEGFVVETAVSRATLPDCVRTFAYWNEDHLRAARLLNSQNGEYTPITMRELGEEDVAFHGAAVKARRIALEGPDLRIDLWYARSDGDWLRLESKSKGGRTLRYIRQ